MRLLLLSKTTGYQTRAFREAAERLGVPLMLGTDRCHVLEDPWRDGAIALRFENPDLDLQQQGKRKEAVEKWRAVANIVEEKDNALAARAWISSGYLVGGGKPERRHLCL